MSRAASAAAATAVSPSESLFSITCSRIRTHLVFGANTDVGKTVVTAGLLRSYVHNHNRNDSSTSLSSAHYIKPLQCGGSGDEAFVSRHASISITPPRPTQFSSQTLFRWETAASPHLASRIENKPVSDDEVLSSLKSARVSLQDSCNGKEMALIETAGGVLSPSSASPKNGHSQHARRNAEITCSEDGGKSASSSWGWSTQADLYQALRVPAILVGDGRLGGISCTLSALESLVLRGYDIHGIILVDDGGGYDNAAALREYACRPIKLAGTVEESHFRIDPERSILSLPPMPQEPEPLDWWYQSPEVEKNLEAMDDWLEKKWMEDVRQSPV